MPKKKPSRARHVTNRPVRKHSLAAKLRPAAIGVIAVGLLWLTFATHVSPTNHLQQTPKVVVVSAPSPKQQSAPVAPTPAPAPVAAHTEKTTTTNIPQSSKPEPVVTPSPSSSVSSLAPVTPPSSGGSSTSSGGSSTTSSPPPPTTTTGYTSSNWSGYLAATGSYTAITGAWVVPSPTGITGVTSADSAWIGIGGVTSGDLIQVGTEDTVSPGGRVSTAAFYELLPSAASTIPSITVSPGDAMTASLREISTGEWTITITDQTNGGTFTLNTAYSSSNSSAEWIEEDPSYSFHRQIPFDNFHIVNFSTGTTTNNGSTVGIGVSGAEPVTMVDQLGNPAATPSSLTGSNFSVTRN